MNYFVEFLYKRSLEYHENNSTHKVTMKDLIDNTLIIDDSIHWWDYIYRDSVIVSKRFYFDVQNLNLVGKLLCF